MKQYRIRLKDGWRNWNNLDVPLNAIDILTVQFNEPLTVEEAKEFFKHYIEKI